MSDHQPSPSRPSAVASAPVGAGRNALLEQVISNTAASGFDPDAWHAMERRDESMIEQEILNGSGSAKFVYQFELAGTKVAGISVIGARQLAYAYGGIQHRMIAAIEKRGALFTYTTYPHEGAAMDVKCSYVRELADEDDFYGVIIEITDIKTGNRIQVEKREFREELRRDGSMFARPHFQVIAQSKAFRNGVLSLIPQDVQLEWKEKQMRLGKGDVITASVADEKRKAVMAYAAKNAVAVNRHAIEALTLDQITGLGEAARGEGGKAAFLRSAVALGIVTVAEVVDGSTAPQEAPAPRAPRQPRQARQEAPPQPQEAQREPEPPPPVEPPHDPQTGELAPPDEDQSGLDFK